MSATDAYNTLLRSYQEAQGNEPTPGALDAFQGLLREHLGRDDPQRERIAALVALCEGLLEHLAEAAPYWTNDLAEYRARLARLKGAGWA